MDKTWKRKKFFSKNSRGYLKKISIKANVATDEGNSWNQTWHWTNDEIGVAVQIWHWVRVELRAWYLSWLERLNGIQWLRVQIPLRPTFYSYFKESFSGEYHIYRKTCLSCLKFAVKIKYFLTVHYFVVIMSTCPYCAYTYATVHIYVCTVRKV